MRVVIDHVAGSRRGQRQEFSAGSRVRFGRHPECEVSFDPHRDIDASSRHAELRSVASGWVLVDLGSSNGTYVEGHRITETTVAQAVPVTIEFGPDLMFWVLLAITIIFAASGALIVLCTDTSNATPEEDKAPAARGRE